jgi:hypothetical protein
VFLISGVDRGSHHGPSSVVHKMIMIARGGDRQGREGEVTARTKIAVAIR